MLLLVLALMYRACIGPVTNGHKRCYPNAYAYIVGGNQALNKCGKQNRSKILQMREGPILKQFQTNSY